MVRFLFPLMVCLGITPPAHTKPPICQDCNLLLISIDTLRPDHMSLYGYERKTTPNIDRHLKDALVYPNATTPSPCTIPAIKQFLSGRFDTQAPHLAEIFNNSGYETAAIISQALLRTAKEERLHVAGFKHWDIQKPHEENQHLMSTRDAKSIADAALAWLSKRRADKPFFLWTHFFDPHDPYDPPSAYRHWLKGPALYTDGDRRRIAQKDGYEGQWQRRQNLFTRLEKENLTALYDGEIAFTDTHVGKIFDDLRRRKLWEKTVVVLVSDHGEWLGEKDTWDHCLTLHEKEVRVPLVFRFPKKIPHPKPSNKAMSTLDILPSLTDVLGLSDPAAHLREGLSIFSTRHRRTTFSAFRKKVAHKQKLTKVYCALKGSQCASWRHVRLNKAKPLEQDAAGTIDSNTKKTLEAFVAAQSVFLKTTDETLETLKALGYTR